jgi:threonyl-tRNA synthetase
LSPVQLKLLSVSDDQIEYTKNLEKQFRAAGIRVEIDIRNEKLGLKIRESEISKTPYIAIIGKSEMDNESLNVRQYGGNQLGEFKVTDFIDSLKSQLSGRVSL